MIRTAVEGTVGALTVQNIELQVLNRQTEQRCQALNDQLQAALAKIAELEAANANPPTS